MKHRTASCISQPVSFSSPGRRGGRIQQPRHQWRMTASAGIQTTGFASPTSSRKSATKRSTSSAVVSQLHMSRDSSGVMTPV